MDSERFLDIAFQYYVVARQAFFCKLLPVTGNLFHHAVEMLLKGGLLQTTHPDQIETKLEEFRKKIKHDLKRLRQDFKKTCNGYNFDKFDCLIEDLDLWEDVRYPEQKHPTFMAFDLKKGSRSGLSTSPSPRTKEYYINLEVLDEFIKEVCTQLQVNPEWIRNQFLQGDESKEIYRRENAHGIL